jgi:hypothetical protein
MLTSSSETYLVLPFFCSAELVYRVENFLTETETTDLLNAAQNLLGKNIFYAVYLGIPFHQLTSMAINF